MSDLLSHEAARDLLAMAALNALSPSELRMLEAHLAICEECRRELAELVEGVRSLAESLPARPMSPERESVIRARLLARAAADSDKVTPIRKPPAATAPSVAPARPSPARPSPASPSPARWLAAAALVIAAGAVAYGIDQRVTVRRLASDIAHLRDTAATMQQRLADQQAIVAGLTGPGVKVIDAAATSARQPYARMFWDQPTNRWTFVAYNLPAAAPGHTYQLWLVTRDQKKVSAGTFAPSANGSALVRATYALPSDSLAAIAVTNEPAGGSAQPTTTPFLVGAAKTD
jgi:anti-sigma factor RsiW